MRRKNQEIFYQPGAKTENFDSLSSLVVPKSCETVIKSSIVTNLPHLEGIEMAVTLIWKTEAKDIQSLDRMRTK